MKKLQQQVVLVALCLAIASAATGQAQAPIPAQVQSPAPPASPTPAPRQRTRTAPPSTVSVDGSEAMFTTMCALVAARSEERRVGKECRCREWECHEKREIEGRTENSRARRASDTNK